MKKFTVTETPLFLHSGIVGLTKKQFEDRKSALMPFKKGQYEIVSEVCFKVGEEIGFSEPIVKTLRSNLVTSAEYAKKGAEAASIEIDIADQKKMKSAFEDLVKRYESLTKEMAETHQILDERLSEVEKLKSYISEMEASFKKLEKAAEKEAAEEEAAK